jgi:hypothetical protein
MKKDIYTIKRASKEVGTIVSSKWKYYGNIGEYGKTHLIQNKKSKEYFLFDQFSVKYSDQDEIELKPLETNLNEKGLKMIFRNLEGIISEEEFREYEDLKTKMEKIMN